MTRPLTEKQRRIRDYIAQCFEKRGLYPTLREIGRNFGISVGTVQDQVAALEAKGVLKKEKGHFRGMTLAEHAMISTAIRLPLLGQIPAGNPIEALENPDDLISMDSSLAGNADYLLRVRGDSMEPEICAGDMVLVRQVQAADDGEIVVAHVGDGEATLKRLRRKSGSAWLQATNPKYGPIETDFRVMGRVLGLVRQFGR